MTTADWAIQPGGWPRRGEDYEILPLAVAQGLISEKEIDASVGRELASRFRVGLFDPPDRIPWSKLGSSDIDTPQNRNLAWRPRSPWFC